MTRQQPGGWPAAVLWLAVPALLASWYQLDSVLKEQAENIAVYRSLEPAACPRDGEPLRDGSPNTAVVKFCIFCGWSYPDDYDVETQAGM